MKKFHLIAVLAAASFVLFFVSLGVGLAQDAKKFRVLDVGERTYEGGPAIAVVLSRPLDLKVRHDSHLVISDGQAVLKSAWVLSDDGRTLYFPNAKPETEYSVSVLETLASGDGAGVLGERVNKVVVTRKITPGVNFVGDGLLLPKDLSEGLPVATINVPAVELEFFRINDKGFMEFVDWGSSNVRRYYDYITQAKQYGELAFSGRFDLDAPPDKRVVRHIPVMEIEALKSPGLYFAVLRQPGEYNYNYQSTYFLVTDVALHARVHAGETVVWASSLANGKPLAGVEVELFDRKLQSAWRGRTDEAGLVVCPRQASSAEYSFIKATHQGQLGLVPLNMPALDLSEFELNKRPGRHKEVFLYAPRDLYRPGEKVVVAGILRNYDGRAVDAPPLRAALFRPDGKKVRNFTWHPENPDQAGPGFYLTELVMAAEAQTGRWRLEVYDDPAKAVAMGNFSFLVEEFLPERMKLDLTSPRETLAPDQGWNIDVKGEYLYGAPASGSNLQTAVRVAAKRDLFEKRPGFEFGDANSSEYHDDWDAPEQTLDPAGRAVIKLESRWSELPFPVSVRASVSLFETGGRAVVRSIEKVMWPTEALIGLRPLFTGEYAQEGMVGFEVIKTGPDGALLPARGLKVELTREDRDYYWEYNETNGWEHRFTEKNYQFLTDSLNLDGVKPAVYQTPLENGRYLLSVSDPDSGMASSYRFYVGFSWSEGDEARSARPEKVNLALDKPSYRPGDVVHLTINPPHAGEGVIMVEGSKMLWSKRMEVPGGGLTLDIPLSAAWDSHDLYISALVLRPGEAKEKITPNRAVGLIHLPLDRSEREMTLTIQAPERMVIKGASPLTVQLTLDPPPREKTYFTLAAVDAGILSITDFVTPEPFVFFFEPRRFGTEAYDLYGKVVELQSGAKARLACGGDIDLSKGGKRPENNVELLSFFQGPLVFDEQGRAEASLILPQDFNGRIRLMAAAFNRNDYGSAEVETTAAAAVVAQISTPRFLAPGDSTELTLDLHNLAGLDQELSVNLTASEPLILEGGERKINLRDQEKTTLSFPLKAGLGVGTGIIHLRVQGVDLEVNQEWKLGVRPGYPAQTRKSRKTLKKGETFTVDPKLADGLMDDGLYLALKISPAVPLDLAGAMRDLIGYPYGCLEQTASQAFPLLAALPENIEKYGLPFINTSERAARLDKAIERISLMQLPTGGFSLWNEQGAEEPYLSVYAADFLLQARSLGFNPPAEMMDKALTRLDFYLNNQWPGEPGDPALAAATRAYAGYVLARVGRAPLGALRIMYDKHLKEFQSELPLAHLGLALKLMGVGKSSAKALAEAAAGRRSPKTYYGDYGSPLRDLALTMALLLNNGPAPAGLDRMMSDLEDLLRESAWYSTQEQFALFQAGLALDRLAKESWRGTLTRNGEEESLSGQGPYLVKPAREEAAQGLSFTSSFPGPLFVSLTASGYPTSPPAQDFSKIFVGRYFYSLAGKAIETNQFFVGDLVLVHLAVKSSKRVPDGLLVDFLPAGLEIENPNFRNSLKLDDEKIQNLSLSGHEIWKLKENNQVFIEEFLNDRYMAALELEKNQTAHLFYLVRAVSPGNFTRPPLAAESMYRPEIRGTGDKAENIVIINKKR
ncbi:MAG: alpha-2-macroglobulin [Pseudomonadota bacterium]